MAVTSDDYLIPRWTKGARNRTIGSVFDSAATARPDAIAVRTLEHRWTWREWKSESDALARALQEKGLLPGEVVAVQLPNCFDFLLLFVAVTRIGAVLMPIHTDNGPMEVGVQLRSVSSAFLVVPDEASAQATADRPDVRVLLGGNDAADEADRTGLPSVRGLAAEWAGNPPLPAAVQPDDVALLLSSSGTTSGASKIAMHSHDTTLSGAEAWAELRPGPAETVAIAIPYTHHYALNAVMMGFFIGAGQVVIGGWNPAEVIELLADTRPDVLVVTPAHLHDLLHEMTRQARAGVSVKSIITGGAKTPASVMTRVEAMFSAQLSVMWGMCEVGVGAVTPHSDPPELKASSVGMAFPDVRLRVVDEQGEQCPPGESGELQCAGPYVFRGYFAAPELTASAVTEDGWFRTGDFAAIDSGGRVYLRGRAAATINVGGKKLNASELEDEIDRMPGAGEFAVVAAPDRRLGEYPCLVIRAGRSELTLAEVSDRLRNAGFAEYKIPVELFELTDFPRTSSGKPQRRKLEELIARLATTRQEFTRAAGKMWPGHTHGEALELVQRVTAAVLELSRGETIGQDTSFRSLGCDSSANIRLRNELAAATGAALPATLAYDYPTPAKVADFLVRESVPADSGQVAADTSVDSEDAADPVVIVGMACRAPGGVTSPDELWEVFVHERDMTSPFPADRGWPLADLYDPDPDAAGRSYVRRGGFLNDVAAFDHGFFAISPREARAMDPQHRLLLEVTWEALEDAGIPIDAVRGTDTGIYIGLMQSDYGPRLAESPADYDGNMLIGTSGNMASGRLAYFLGAQGPAVSVDTACSSSVVALLQATRAVSDGECPVAVAGAVTVLATPASFVDFSRQRVLAPDGRCKPFANGADGVAWAEGAVTVVVERLSMARKHGHRVLAVVRGGAINSDGASNGLTAPNGTAQQRMLRRALSNARLAPSDIDAVEAHGTGTPLGDAVEAGALLEVYGSDRSSGLPLLVGSAKSNLGHTGSAAGLMSVLKVILALRHELLPRTLHVDEPTASVEWSGAAVRLLTEAVPWPASDRPRRAGVSAFGLSGTNAHVVLEEPPDAGRKRRPGVPLPEPVPWVLSAADPAALRAVAVRLLDQERREPNRSAVDVGHSLVTTRSTLACRAVVVADGPAARQAALTDLAEGRESRNVILGSDAGAGRTAFLFPGAGAEWPGMAAGLLADSVMFADVIADCERALAPLVPWSLSRVLRGEPDQPCWDENEDVRQLALFAVSVSLAELWRWHGVVPEAVLGHSRGEVAAAHVAGALSLPDACRILVKRGEALGRPECAGATAVLPLTRQEAEALVAGSAGRLSLAAINGPSSVVVSGDDEAVTELLSQYGDKRSARRVPTAAALHSPRLAGAAEDLSVLLADVSPLPSAISFWSSIDGRPHDAGDLTGGYWGRNLREKVEFAKAITAMIDSGYRTFLEVGPHPVLGQQIERIADELGVQVHTVATMHRSGGGRADIMGALAEAHVHGLPVLWSRVFTNPPGAPVTLPSYPFRQHRHWLDRHASALYPVSADMSVADTVPVVPAEDVVGRRAQLMALVQSAASAVSGRRVADGPIKADDSFQSAGFTSMSSVELRNRLRRATGIELSATAAFDYGTPSALVEHLLQQATSAAPAHPEPATTTPDVADEELPTGFEGLYRRLCRGGAAVAALELTRQAAVARPRFTTAEQAPPPLIERSATGPSGPALVCLSSVAAMSGLHEYTRFAEHFAGIRDVISIAAPGFVAEERLPANLDVLAEVLAAAVDEAAGAKPYVLCGHSSGGWIALLIAHRLTARGVVLLDCPWRSGAEPIGDQIATVMGDFTAKEESIGLTSIGMARLTAMGGYLHSFDTWQPTMPVLPTLHVRAENTPFTANWPGVGQTSVPGGHFDMLSTYAKETAREVDRWLDQCGTQTGAASHTSVSSG